MRKFNLNTEIFINSRQIDRMSCASCLLIEKYLKNCTGFFLENKKNFPAKYTWHMSQKSMKPTNPKLNLYNRHLKSKEMQVHLIQQNVTSSITNVSAPRSYLVSRRKKERTTNNRHSSNRASYLRSILVPTYLILSSNLVSPSHSSFTFFAPRWKCARARTHYTCTCLPLSPSLSSARGNY